MKSGALPKKIISTDIGARSRLSILNKECSMLSNNRPEAHEFYQIISDQLANAQLTFSAEELKTSDIVEYMVLERTGKLDVLQGVPLKCIFLQGYTSNQVFQDNFLRSSIQLGFWGNVDSGMQSSLRAVVAKLRESDTLNEFHNDYENRYYNYHQVEHAFILLDNDIEASIKSSALFMAAGNLSNLTIVELFELKAKVNFYKLIDSTIFQIIDGLMAKVSLHIKQRNFSEKEIAQANLAAESILNRQKTFDARFIELESWRTQLREDRLKEQEQLKEQERLREKDNFSFISYHPILLEKTSSPSILTDEKKFDALFNQLKIEIRILMEKGTYAYGDGGNQDTKNPNFIPAYQKVAPVANKLMNNLEQARSAFFHSATPKINAQQFQLACSQAIDTAKQEFAQHRGWGQLDPILKGILGFLAGITVIPGVIVQVKSQLGFWGTFFSQKTNSLMKLEAFEKEIGLSSMSTMKSG